MPGPVQSAFEETHITLPVALVKPECRDAKTAPGAALLRRTQVKSSWLPCTRVQSSVAQRPRRKQESHPVGRYLEPGLRTRLPAASQPEPTFPQPISERSPIAAGPRVASITHYNQTMATTIRPATRADVPCILAFIRSLAAYARAPASAIATEADLEKYGFSDNPLFFCLIAEHDGSPAGFALYFFNYSTWTGKPGIYLEDLFVEPELRGLGIGKALLLKVAAIAKERGCLRLQWAVLDWNTTAIDFYQAMGAEFLDEWRSVRVSGEALKRLATCGGADGACAP